MYPFVCVPRAVLNLPADTFAHFCIIFIVNYLSIFLIKPSFLLGNLHLNITTPEHSDEVLNAIEPYVFEWTG